VVGQSRPAVDLEACCTSGTFLEMTFATEGMRLVFLPRESPTIQNEANHQSLRKTNTHYEAASRADRAETTTTAGSHKESNGNTGVCSM
jgi:hypothetical protein